jgi:hypothetical protein
LWKEFRLKGLQAIPQTGASGGECGRHLHTGVHSRLEAARLQRGLGLLQIGNCVDIASSPTRRPSRAANVNSLCGVLPSTLRASPHGFTLTVEYQPVMMVDILTIMFDKKSGRVAYAVLAFDTFLGLGGQEHAIPWGKLD